MARNTADMPIRPYGSSIAGAIPDPSLMKTMEIALNSADSKIFFKHSDGTLKVIDNANVSGLSASISSKANSADVYSRDEIDALVIGNLSIATINGGNF